MVEIALPADGLEILRATNMNPNTKNYLVGGWIRWNEACRADKVDPMGATPEQAIECFTRLAVDPTICLRKVRDAVSRTYREAGLEPPIYDPRIGAAIRKQKGKPPLHTPTHRLRDDPARKQEYWVSQFINWCHENNKPHLPAHPDDIAEFLEQIAESQRAGTRYASSSISRYHSDNGYGRTSQLPQVKAVVAPINAEVRARKPNPDRKNKSASTQEGLDIIRASSLSKSTQANYCIQWNKWGRWCDPQGIDPLQTTPDQLERYVDENAHEGYRAIGNVCLAITLVYRERGQEPPTMFRQVLAAREKLGGFPRLEKPNKQLSAKELRTGQRWLALFINRCESRQKPSLPANLEDIVLFSEENHPDYTTSSLRIASNAVSRYHLDHGYASTAQHPLVKGLMKNLKKKDCEGSLEPKPAKMSIPEHLAKRLRRQENWQNWCSDHQIDHKQATPDHFATYLRHHTTHLLHKTRRQWVTAISSIYPSGCDPTKSEIVKAVLEEMKNLTPIKVEKRIQNRTRPLDRLSHVEELRPDQLPAGLTEEDANRIRENLAFQIRPQTRQSYNTKWEHYEQWCIDIGISTEIATKVHVLAYLSVMAEIWRCSTVEQILNAIRYIYDHDRPTDNPARDPIVSNLMNGIRRRNPQAPEQMDPINDSHFHEIARVAQNPRPREKRHKAILRGAVDIAILALMRDALLRISEAADARWLHLKREPDGTGRLTIPRSKGDQTAKGDVLFISQQTMAALDSMLKIKHSQGIDTQADDRIFQLGRGSIDNHIKKACEQAGLTGRYGGHSCRIGMAQDLLRAGASLASLMLAGRWKHSGMPIYYTRNAAARDGAVAAYHKRHPAEDQLSQNPRSSYGIIPVHTRAKFGT